ncbi:hypothetical protein JCM17844_23800 [Iodidimonas gelatinilytica]|uniref:Uncharacterized protein n=1 Tax=Iodidimonas gelatinilytica TaxID=1236966 RepID=A0A5A7MTX9_9PROT|nr:hypothetical protein [Iodidimonas gelatinilytica]GEQ98743.1 hypothetical protein JCM17844_23800 [Iodidimonas gelatinilytica]GER00888.1 hypothetical protein JCM17845_15110 [Iodidimonas gelatinilytica]
MPNHQHKTNRLSLKGHEGDERTKVHSIPKSRATHPAMSDAERRRTARLIALSLRRAVTLG